MIVLSWNRRDELLTTLSLLKEEADPTTEVIVVDNGSTDGSASMVAACHPEVQLVRLPHNLGIDGLNAGMRRARGEYFVLLDDDSHPAPGCLQRMRKHFEERPSLGAAAFTIIAARDNKTVWPAPGEVYPDGRAMVFIGCGVGLRRQSVEEVGYFDAAYFLYLNELYLTVRLFDAGYEVLHFPDLVAYHRVSSMHRSSARTVFFAERNMLWFMWQHFPIYLAALFGPYRIARQTVYFLYHNRKSECYTLFQAFVAGYLKLHRVLKKRQLVRPSTRAYISPYLRKWYL